MYEAFGNNTGLRGIILLHREVVKSDAFGPRLLHDDRGIEVKGLGSLL